MIEFLPGLLLAVVPFLLVDAGNGHARRLCAGHGRDCRRPMSGQMDRNEWLRRTRARRRALQAVYAWRLSGGGMAQVPQPFPHQQTG
ncbi:MAG: hypothetical protein M0Q42_11395 [Xanthomonadales bacterium]|nr:hypothetical protein [Xanthomonadales bacterium]